MKYDFPPGRYHMLRQFRKRSVQVHFESDNLKHILRCAMALIDKAKINGVEYVAVVDTHTDMLMFEKDASY